jgi:hypothetical protein
MGDVSCKRSKHQSKHVANSHTFLVYPFTFFVVHVFPSFGTQVPGATTEAEASVVALTSFMIEGGELSQVSYPFPF